MADVVGGGPKSGTPARAGRHHRGGGFFEVYKRRQGYWTRTGTAVGAGVMILAGADFAYQQLAIIETDIQWTSWVRIGVPVLLVAALALVLFWVVGRNKTCCDFMIATEGEMKKVNWTTRREIIGSTKVVIVFTLLLSFLLFFVDLLFMQFFGAIGVLRAAPTFFGSLFGSGS